MKKTILFLLAAIGFFIFPSSKVLAQAQVTGSHWEGDVAHNTAVCDGTVLAFTGYEVHDTQVVSNKNRVNIMTHIRGNYRATDAAGNTYIGHTYYNETQNRPSDNGAYSLYVIFSVHFVSQGSAPDFTLRQTLKTTVNANGEMTVYRYDPRTSCD